MWSKGTHISLEAFMSKFDSVLVFFFHYLKTVMNMLKIKEIKQLGFNGSVFCFVLFLIFAFYFYQTSA